MIPKTIHYCWFGRGEMPPLVKWCIKSWRKHLPDYELKLWNEDNFDVDSVPFVKEAYEARKYAFVADYVRLHALYTEGGIYLDSDIKVLRPLDEFLKYDFVASHEYHPGLFLFDIHKLSSEGLPADSSEKIRGLGIGSTVLMAAKGLPYIKDVMGFYRNEHFVDADGHTSPNDFIIGGILSKVAEKYGYRYTTREIAMCGNGMVLTPYAFVNNALFLRRGCYALHFCLGSWNSSGKMVVRHPVYEYYKMLLRARLRGIKHLFMSRQRVQNIYGEWF